MAAVRRSTLAAPRGKSPGNHSLRLDTPKGKKFLRELARFSAGDWSGGADGSQSYHAAQNTRLRDFTGGGLAYRSRPEEDMLRPFDRAKIVARARLMFRNNPYLAALLLAYVQEIGTPTYKSNANLGTLENSKAYNDAREAKLTGYFLDCETDHALSLDQVIEIYNFEDCIAGELFIVDLLDGSQQLIPSELCGSPGSGTGAIPAEGTFQDGTPFPKGSTERDGIVRDAGKTIIGYRFAQRDPQTAAVRFTPDLSVVVPAAFVTHLYNPDRCEMNRGVPLLAAILNFLLDVYETAEARAQQVKNQACLSMWITKNIDPYNFAQAMQGAIRSGQLDNAASLKQAVDKRSAYQEIKKGSVYYGEVGEQLTLVEPKVNAQNFHDHYIDLLQVCAACLNGLPVEVAVEGFRSSNYSSARATMNKWKRNCTRKRRRIAQKYLNPLQLWQTNRAEFFGDLPKIPLAEKSKCHWGWPAIPDIDGLKTAMQNAAKLAMGSTNLGMICAEDGYDADIIRTERIREDAAWLKGYITEAIALGFTPDEARTWAMTRMPAGDGRALAALITVTGALGADEPPAAPPPKK